MSDDNRSPSPMDAEQDPSDPCRDDDELGTDDPLSSAIENSVSNGAESETDGTLSTMPRAESADQDSNPSRAITTDSSLSRAESSDPLAAVNGNSNGSRDVESDNDDLIIEEPEDPLAEVETTRKRKLSGDESEDGLPKKIAVNGDRVLKPVVIELDGTQEIKQAIAQHAERKKSPKKRKEGGDGSYSVRTKTEGMAERRVSLRQRVTPVKLAEPETPEESSSSEEEVPRDLPSVTITPARSNTSQDPLSIEPVRKSSVSVKPTTKQPPGLRSLPSVTITKTVAKNQNQAKQASKPDKTTIVLVDTNSILQGKGPVPARGSPSLPPALSALYKSLPAGLSINQSPGVSITTSPASSKPPMVSLPMLIGGGVTVTNPALSASPAAPPVVEPPVVKPPPMAPFVQSLLAMDETACIVEAPSFVAPYLIEKPGDAIVKFLENRIKELKDLEKKLNGEEGKEETMEVEDGKEKSAKKELETKEASPKDKIKTEPAPNLKGGKKDDIIVDKSNGYFDSSIGKLFQDIGMSLVTEYVQNDFLNQQTRKARKVGLKNLSSDERLTIASLERALEKSRANNEAFIMPLQKCPFCSFHTESSVVLAHHMETPHMMKYTYYCNFCQFDTREAAQILSHVDSEHSVKGKLEKAPMAHQCIFCPFEDNLKSKVNRHIVTCLKRFKQEENLVPPIDWDPPAKVSKTAKSSFTNLKTPTPAATAAALNMLHPLMAKNQMLLATMQAHQAAQQQQAMKKIQQKQAQKPAQFRSPGGQQVFLPSNMAALQGNQLFQIMNSSGHVILGPSTSAGSKFSVQFQPGGGAGQGTSKSKAQSPSISITPLPKAGSSPAGASPGTMITKGGVTVSPVANSTMGVRPGQPAVPGQKQTFVVCEICDGYIKDLEQLRNHMQWIHKVKIHPKMIHNRPPLNCQKCQFRFFTDQGLERHLLGTHGLVTSSMQEAANRGQDAGRCPVCGKVYQWRLLTHVARDHSMTLKPAHLSYKCTVCTATFGMYKQFENHVYSAHSNVAKRGEKGAESPKTPKSGKPLKINDEITIIPQLSKTAQEKTDAVTSMLKKSGVEVIAKGAASVDAGRKEATCDFCSVKDNLDSVEIKGAKVNVCKGCSKKLVGDGALEYIKSRRGNVDIIELTDDDDSNVSAQSMSSRSGVSITAVQKAANPVSATESDSSDEEEVKPAEKIIAPNDDLDLD